MLSSVPQENLPPVLRERSYFEPRGNVPAEIAAAVADIRGRNQVIFCDLSFDSIFESPNNVVRLIHAAQWISGVQERKYIPALSLNDAIPGRLSRIGELGFGSNINSRVMLGYVHMMENWQPGDRLFLFGFSQGAYILRVLASFVYMVGLLHPGDVNLLPEAWRLFRRCRFDGAKESRTWEQLRRFRDLFAREITSGDTKPSLPITFLGAWDSVLVALLYAPRTFQFTAQNPGIASIRHAVSIDERRSAFTPQLFAESGANADVNQVWFPGVHADVGGGYREGTAWRDSLKWMITEAQKAGLQFDDARLAEVLQPSSSDLSPDSLHESLQGMWWPYEFYPQMRWSAPRPRLSPTLGLGRSRFIPPRALIHKSALERIRRTEYSPPNLSPAFLAQIREMTGELPDQLPYSV